MSTTYFKSGSYIMTSSSEAMAIFDGSCDKIKTGFYEGTCFILVFGMNS